MKLGNKMQHHFSKVMKGQHSEFIAAAWLIKQNYLVYIKTQDNDPIDLIAVDRGTGKVLKLDVKSVSIRKSGPKKGYRISRIVNEHQKKIGVKLLYVYDDGRCDFHGKD
jgi:hypothetical protein